VRDGTEILDGTNDLDGGDALDGQNGSSAEPRRTGTTSRR
jgi:hypothetical protein